MAETGEVPQIPPREIKTAELLTRLPEKKESDAKLKESLTRKVNSIRAEKRAIAEDIKQRKDEVLNRGLHGILFRLIISDADFKSTNDEHYWGVRAAERKVRKRIWEHLPPAAKRDVLLKMESRAATPRGGNK